MYIKQSSSAWLQFVVLLLYGIPYYYSQRLNIPIHVGTKTPIKAPWCGSRSNIGGGQATNPNRSSWGEKPDVAPPPPPVVSSLSLQKAFFCRVHGKS